MELATAVTVWITFGAWLFLPTVNAPARFSRIALWLCGSELLAAAIWTYGSDGCAERPCAPVAEAARIAAALDIPFMTGVAMVLGCAYATRRARLQARAQRGTWSQARANADAAAVNALVNAGHAGGGSSAVVAAPSASASTALDSGDQD